MERGSSGDSFERKVVEMDAKMRQTKQRRDFNDESLHNYTDLTMTLMKK